MRTRSTRPRPSRPRRSEGASMATASDRRSEVQPGTIPGPGAGACSGPLADAIRREIADCGLSQYELSRRSGVEHGAISKFFCFDFGLGPSSVERLCDVLGLRVVHDPKATLDDPPQALFDVIRSAIAGRGLSVPA